MAHIVPMILRHFRAELQDKLQTNVSPEDPARAVVVKIGPFKDDPVLNNIYVSINGGDPDDPAFEDGVITMDDMERIGLYFPVREVGGGELWWRRGTTKIGMYFVAQGFDEDTALEYAYTVLGRVSELTEQMKFVNFTDDYGEQAILPVIYASSLFESGGPPNQYIFRGKIRWQVLTERP